MKPSAAAALAAVLAAAGCAAGPRAGTRTVVVEGWAPLGSLPRTEARRLAVADARRRAVEEVAGVEVASVATVDDAGIVRERVSTAGRGSLRTSRVLGESVSDGGLSVRVKAVVELPVPGAARRVGWIPGTGPNVRFAPEGTLGAEAKAAMRRAWTSFGGTCSADAGGEDVVIGVAARETVVDEPRLKPYSAVRARVTLAARTSGGMVIWSASRENAALGLDEEQARAKALDAAALAAARAAAEDLPSRLWLTARGESR
ncbi:MAG: hypothetical protein KGJ84_01090 [Elusimicrobia bacterium]|nr:hypothetical protein [Elusimicrobiota bacterium]